MPLAPIPRTIALALAAALAGGCDAGSGQDAPPDMAAPPVAQPPAMDPTDDDHMGDDPADGTPSDGADGETTVPSRFQGRYASDQAACGTPGNPSRLSIESDTITFHESSGPVTAVASGPSDITITVELTGEGETREATYRFRLSDDGDILTDLGGGMERIRCR